MKTFCLQNLKSIHDFELFDAFIADGADVPHVPEVLVVVKSIADPKLVRDLQGNIVRCIAIALQIRIG